MFSSVHRSCMLIRAACPPREDIVMRLSSSFVAPSFVAVVSTILLCGPAISQTCNRPSLLTSERHGRCAEAGGEAKCAEAAGKYRGGSRQTSSTGSSTAQTPSAEPSSVQGRIAKLEREASSCNGGCQTSFKTANAPWVGCSFGAGEAAGTGPYSLTCTDTLTYNSYLDCTSTKVFLSWSPKEARWHCTGLLAGGKLTQEKVAQLKRSGW